MSFPHSGPLIPPETLKNAKRVLYMTHLAIGDFVFQGVYLKAFAEQNPHLSLDVWIDDCRDRSKGWHAGRNTVLCQWLTSESYINRVYPIAKDSEDRAHLISAAQEVEYDLVIFIATQRSELYAKYARQIAPAAYIVGSKAKPLSNPLSKHLNFKKVDRFFDIEKLQAQSPNRISAIYQKRFETCVGPLFDEMDASRGLTIDVPEQFVQQANECRDRWSKQCDAQPEKFVLLNHLSTTPRRNYKWHNLVALIRKLHQQHPQLAFVLNLPPNEVESVNQKMASEPLLEGLPLFLFSATDHFFQLPAMIKICDLIISVETAIMHLAASLRRPSIVLMRASAKEWQPTHASKILFAQKRVDDIRVDDVVKATNQVIS